MWFEKVVLVRAESNRDVSIHDGGNRKSVKGRQTGIQSNSVKSFGDCFRNSNTT